ncbi:MAG TPA: NADH-quinone oxidoreductase subunit N [Anaerolineae bacterium]|nr:NADH-quinone oxidoreductase subunit N [Anaerolineae bacterium]
MEPIQFPDLSGAIVSLLPELAVAITAFLVMFIDLFVKDKRVLGYVSILGLIVAAVLNYVLLNSPTWLAFQQMTISDGYSLVLNLIFIVTAILSILVSLSYLGERELQRGEYYALLLFSTVGMMLMGAATDLIVVFLGLEIMSIALYVLAAFNRQQLGSGEAGMKYFVLGAFASAFFLYGVALVYGATGSTYLPAMGAHFASLTSSDPLALVGLGLLLVGFAFKVAAVPFQWWTPDVYQGAPTSVTAFMSVGAKAAGFASLIRVLMVSFSAESFLLDWQVAVAALAVITMTVGNIAALAQRDVKRMLAYSSIAHAGYLLVGVVPGTMNGVEGVLFYLMSYTFINIGAFAVISLLERRSVLGSSIGDYAGLSKRSPLLAGIMLLFMVSLTGLPLMLGFWGKVYVFKAAIEAGWTWLAIVGVLNSVVSAFYYLGVGVQMYFRSAEDEAGELAPVPSLSGPVMVTLVLAAFVTVIFGFWPTPLVDLTALAAFG